MHYWNIDLSADWPSKEIKNRGRVRVGSPYKVKDDKSARSKSNLFAEETQKEISFIRMKHDCHGVSTYLLEKVLVSAYHIHDVPSSQAYHINELK